MTIPDGTKLGRYEIRSKIGEVSEQRYVSPYDLALIHHGLGQKEECFKWLSRAYEIDDGWMIYITVDPRWQGLQADPQFIEIVQHVGLRLH